MFIFFPIEEHPSHDRIEQGFQQEIDAYIPGIDADDLVLVDREGITHRRPRIEEETNGYQQTGLQTQEELEAQLG